MIYCVELDGVICTKVDREQDYGQSKPIADTILYINQLYHEGHTIKVLYFRNKGKKNWDKAILFSLKDWGLKFHQLVSDQTEYDVVITNNSISPEELRRKFIPQKEADQETVGVVCSCFDIMHAGHCMMLKDAKNHCDRLIAGLQTDPTIDRPDKNKPIQSLEERYTVLESCKYVDEIRTYSTENSLIKLLSEIKPDVRVLGDDWKGKEYTGQGIAREEYFHKRSTHSYSTSNLRQRIYEKEKTKS